MPESNVLVIPEDGGERQILFPDSAVLLSSQSSDWAGVSIERLLLTMHTPEHHHDAHFLTLQLGAPAQVEWREGSRHQRARAIPGEFSLIGAGISHEVRYEDADVLAVSLVPELFQRAANEIVGEGVADRLEIVPQNGIMDRQVERFGLLLKNEIEAGCPSGRLFGESLGQALAAHLVAHYAFFPHLHSAVSNIQSRITEDVGRLSPRQLRRTLDFLEAHLAEDVSLAEIAQAAELSPYHFARQFKATVGVAPHAYLTERRVERAKVLLAHTELPIAQIATAVGFAHQSHFTRHFRRSVGTTPARFR